MSNSRIYDHEYNSSPCRIFSDMGTVKIIEFDNGQRTAVPAEKVKQISEQIISARNILNVEEKPSKAEREGYSVTPPETSTNLFETVDETDKPNLNEMTFSELIDLKGVGRASAKKIIENKPANGYTSLEQLKGLNTDISRLDWDIVAEQVSF